MDNFERGEQEIIRHPEELYWEEKFHFISPLPLDEAVRQLFAIEDRRRLVSRRKFVRAFEMEDGSVYFFIHVPRQPASGWMIGRLQTETQHFTTYVEGRVGIEQLYIRGYFLFIGILCLIFLIIFPVGTIFAPFLFWAQYRGISRDGRKTCDELKALTETNLKVPAPN